MDYSAYESRGNYVYEWPLRLWHWTMAPGIAVLMITGFVIGMPLHSITGDPTYLFYMGYTRMAHFIAGYVVGLGLIFRVIYACFGNKYSRNIFIIPFWSKEWWGDLWHDIRWYLFLDRQPRVHMGHNPLAQLGMASFLVFLILMCVTGFAIFQEEASPWFLAPFRIFADLAYLTGGNPVDLHSWHRLGMKLVLAFVIVHMYMVFREEIMGRTTLVSTMINGYRQVRDE